MYINFTTFNPIALGKAKIVYSFGLSECSRVKNLNQLFMCYLKENRIIFNQATE